MTRRRSTPPPPELAALAELRLERGLSFDQLAADMTAAGYPFKKRTLHTILTNPAIRPHETTLHRVRRYLAHEREAGRLLAPPADAPEAPASTVGAGR